MQEWIISMMNQFGYLGILFLIAIENIFPPIPSEIILTFGGFMTTTTNMNIIGVILVSTIGSILGALVLYGIGRFLDRERIEKIIDGKIGKILRLKKKDIEKAEQWFSKRGKKTVFICRFIPIVRSLISIPAGMVKMNLGLFLLLTTLGTLIWNSVLVSLGAMMGSSWEKIAHFMDQYSKIALVGLVVLFLVACFVFYRKRLGKKKK